MGKIYTNPMQNNADFDAITAESGDVIKGKTCVDKEGEAAEGTMELTGNVGAVQILSGYSGYSNNPKSKISGTMVNNGAVNTSLPINGSYTIPAGYHNGQGKVTQSITTQGGSTTTPGTANKTIVSANRYVSGNIIVAGDANLKAENIKRGVTIFGVKGTCPYSVYLYNNGQNTAGLTVDEGVGVHVAFESSYIEISLDGNVNYLCTFASGNSYNLADFSSLYLEIEMVDGGGGTNRGIEARLLNASKEELASGSVTYNGEGTKTIAVNVSSITYNGKPQIRLRSDRASKYYRLRIKRIWFK